jgi:FAD/FMN-containing dehydrogenase
MTTEIDTNLINRLRSAVDGEVIAPDGATYDEARTVVYGGFDRRPAAVVRAGSASEVAAVIGIAADTGVEFAVRSGGHSLAGHSASEGGIVLDLRALNSLQIDPEARIAWAGTGLTAGEYTKAAGEYGLATGFGDAPTVGVGGITLGGGMGLLTRKYGLTIDNLLAAEIVTADGEVLDVDANNHPDLFWAIRGGGGNFGVATKFKYQLQPVPQIVGGMMILPASAELVSEFIDLASSAPEELSTILNVMSALPMPLPEPIEGPVAMALMVYAGDPEAGERVVAPFRQLAEPIMGGLGPITYPEIYQEEEGDFHPVAVVRNNFADTVDEETVVTTLERLQTSTAMFSVLQVRPLGGAMARVPNDATAFAHRERPFLTSVASIYENVDETADHKAWVEPLAEIVANGEPGTYSGFLGDEGEDRIRAAYPGPTYDRLAQIKAKYDPDNLFRMNQNIKPA